MAWVQDNYSPTGVSWVEDQPSYTVPGPEGSQVVVYLPAPVVYDPMQSLPVNLARAGLRTDGTFVSAIETAFARAGYADYGGERAWNLIRSADPARAQIETLDYANELLRQAGIAGFAGVQEWVNANEALPGHNEGLLSFRDLAIPFEAVADLASEEGFQVLAAVATAGAALGASAGATGANIGAGGLTTEAATLGVAEEAAALGIVSTPAVAPALAAAGTVATPAATAAAGAALPAAVTKAAQTAVAAVQAAAGQWLARELAPAREPALIAPPPREPALPLLPLLALAGLAAFAVLR